MSRTPLLLAALGVLAGSLLSVQAAINAQLSRGLGHPVLAAVVSFSAGLAALVASAVLLGLAIPSRATAASIPAYLWFTGGLLGAGYLSANILLTPRLGTGAVMSLAIGGQLLAALLLDHFGVLGLAPRAAGIERLVGAGLLLGGVYLITRY